jgi:hypothetical protein
MEGLLGLTKSINTREGAMQDLGVLERMNQSVQQDKQAEMQSQQQEAMFYERMYETADGMLEKDRKKINERVRMAQRQVREHLSQTGGSRKDFMANGGLTVMNDMTNGIIRSDEAVTYQENKKNLAKILEAKEKGMGHLIAPADVASAEAYEKNPEGGKITYSGIMSEIEIPPSANFDYGTEIPIENIITYGSNAMKITANYKINYPNRPAPNWEELVEFAKKMKYGGTGSNTTRMRANAQEAKKRAEYDKKTNTDKSSKTRSVVTEHSVLQSKVKPGTNIEKINKPVEEGGYGGDYYAYMKEQDKGLRQFVGKKAEMMSLKKGLDQKGFDGNDLLPSFLEGGFLEKDWTGLKDSYHVFEGNESKLAKAILGEEGAGYKVEGNQIIGYLPGKDAYRMDGIAFDKGNELNADKHKGNYTLKGITTAWKAPMASDSDKEALIIDVLNSDGEIDKDKTEEVHKGYGQGELKSTYVMALEDEDGNMFYHEVDLSRPDQKRLAQNAIGANDDITETIEQGQEAQATLDNIEKLEAEQQIQFETAKNTLNQKVFNNPAFKGEAEQYHGANSGGQENRYDMMKSFYMAFDFVNNSYLRDEKNPEGKQGVDEGTTQQAIDNQWFTTMAAIGGIEEDLKNYEQGNNPEAIIQKWVDQVNDGEEPNSMIYNRNMEYAKKWKQVFKML